MDLISSKLTLAPFLSPILDPIDAWVLDLAGLTGLHYTGVRVLIIYLSSFFIALGFRIRWINRHFYAISVGFVMQYFLFREGMIHFLLMCVVTKILMHTISREKQGFIIFAAAMSHSTFYLTLECIYRYGDAAITYCFYVMFLCQKLSTLGYCYQDGMGKFDKELNDHTRNTSESILLSNRKCKLFKIPTMVEIVSYATYPCTCYIGPSFEYKYYIDFIDQKGQYRNIPFDFWKGFTKYIKGIPCFVILLVSGSIASKDLLVSDEFAEMNFLKQLFYSYIFVMNFKYSAFACWFFADGTSILSGLGFSGRKEKNEYNSVKAFSWANIELATSPRQIINNWNFQVSNWLRNYIYIRFERGDPKRKGKATLAVFLISALWHGFLPCYYIFFFCLDLLLSTSRKIHKHGDMFGFMPKILRKVLATVLTHFMITQLGCLYLLRTGDNIIKYCRSTNCIGLISLAVAYLFTKVFMSKDPKKKIGKEENETKEKENKEKKE
ncbi:unnamed protein product [Moneuplotes crassus]|uniref:Uncharacterized protein n=1 Tax=Euplotes crassus TaxID=5936 RepID=A0AAD1U403_EUPCR|nr:unnamed protein product [Moneuplotes crassus]